jgi:hypothetical protein
VASEAEGTWMYFPQVADGGYHRLEVRTADGYAFACLTWATCSRCRLGLVAKIRVTDLWQRRGYGTRMVKRAMRDYETYTWVTTPQSPDGQLFFPAVGQATSAAFAPGARRCVHMQAVRGAGRGEPQQEQAPPR